LTVVATLSLPRYSGRWCSLRNLEAYGLADDLLKRFEVSRRCPDLQLSVAAAMELNDDVVASVVDFKARDRLGMTAVEALRHAED